jgi:hypothetical protein
MPIQNRRQRLASQRNWHRLQLKGAVGTLRALNAQTGNGLTLVSIAAVEHELYSRIDEQWKAQVAKLAQTTK